MPDDPVTVDDENRPLGNSMKSDHVLVVNPVLANHLFVEITQERERQPLGVVKRLQRKERVDADAEHFRLRMVESGELVAERAELFLAHRAERGGEKCQDYG